MNKETQGMPIWDFVAASFLETAQRNADLLKTEICIFEHKKEYFLGDYRQPFPSDTEITLISHTSYKILKELIDAILLIRKVPVLVIDDELILGKRVDYLRKSGNRLSRLTPKQTAYFLSLNIEHREITGDILSDPMQLSVNLKRD
jgi:hypothetical protein